MAPRREHALKARTLHICTWLGLLATVLGARWLVVFHYATDLPEWDQWDAEGLHLLLPWYRGEPLLPALFHPHNEHYVVLTKLLNLALTILNGKWDQRLECVVNALLPALVALGLLAWSRSFVSSATRPFVALFLAFTWGLPFAWHNIISGFHSQQFFLIGLSFAAIVLLPFSRSFSVGWWGGTAAVFLSLLSMASGMFAGATILALLTARLVLRGEALRSVWPAIAIALAAVLLGWVTRHEVSYHLPLRAQSASDFILTLIRSLQWPAPLTAWSALLLWLPWLGVVIRVLQQPRDGLATEKGWGLVGLGVWIWLQLLATAYVRGAGGPFPAIRYLDTLVFGSCVNFLALIWLWRQRLNSLAPSMFWPACSIAWILVFGWGAFEVARKSIRDDLATFAGYHRDTVIHTRAFLASHDPAYLTDPIPYPGVNAFIERISKPELAKLMPASVRPAVLLQPAGQSAGFSVRPLGEPFREGDTDAFRSNYPIFRRTWVAQSNSSSLEARSWSSAPVRLPQRSGQLIFEVFGELDGEATTLDLLDARSGELLSSIRTFGSSGDAWTFAAAPKPAVPFIVHAQNMREDRLFAFAEPVVMPVGSYLAWRLSARGAVFAIGGLTLLLMATVGSIIALRDARNNSHVVAL